MVVRASEMISPQHSRSFPPSACHYLMYHTACEVSWRPAQGLTQTALLAQTCMQCSSWNMPLLSMRRLSGPS